MPEITKDLTGKYKKKKSEIQKRLKEFKNKWKQPDEAVFSELCFCICTPQSRAAQCDKAVQTLTRKRILFNGTLRELKAGLRGVRFPTNKAGYIFESRKLFNVNGKLKIKDKVNINNIPATREWFVKNVKGIGFKEASHFLRNIGFGKKLAILDVHVLRNLEKYKVINKTPKTISKKAYLKLEEKFIRFSKSIKIPPDELDLLFWSNETGSIFK
ncbi:MAG: N-glycosylase/DNA lyase [Candidatus Omnitrophota bacterium]